MLNGVLESALESGGTYEARGNGMLVREYRRLRFRGDERWGYLLIEGRVLDLVDDV